MKVTEYLDAINATLQILYYSNQARRFCCKIQNGEIKEGITLVSTHGNADSPRGAASDYFKQIAGHLLVINAHSKEYRREFTVPSNLEVDI